MRKTQLLAILSATFIAIALGGCATRGAPPASLDSPRVQVDSGRQAPSGQTVLTFTETQPLPVGDQTHVTITDSDGNTLYERLPSLDQTYRVPLPADGKLYVTTHWSGGPPTRQELVLPVQKGAPNQVVIRWDKNAKSYTTAAPPVQLASEPRQVEPIPTDIQRTEVIRGPSAQYGSSPSGVILSLNCFRFDRGTGTLSLAPISAPDCLRVDPATGALAPGGDVASLGCFRLDPGTGLLSPIGAPSPDCLRVDPATGALAPGGDVASRGCFRLSPGTGLLSPVGAPSPDCVRVDRTTGALLLPVGTPIPLARKGWSLSGGYGIQEAPIVDFGTLIPGGPGSQVAAVKSKNGVSGIFAGVRLETPWGYADVEYFNGDKTERASERVGGAQIGFVYNQPNINNSFGLNTGPNGGNFEIKAEVTRYGVRYASPYAFYESLAERLEYKSEIRPLLHFGRTETNYSGWAQSINFPAISATTDQQVNENRYGIGIRGQHTRKFTDAIVGRFVLDLDFLYRKADLSSKQYNVCGAPGCSPANTFTASNSDSDSGFTWGAGFGTSLEYSFTKNSSLGLELGVQYLKETAALKNPTSTIDIDRPPHLEGHSVHSFSIGARYRYEW